MNKGFVLLFVFVLAAVFSAAVFADGVKADFNVKEGGEIPLVAEPFTQAPTAPAVITSYIPKHIIDSMYNEIVETLMHKISKTKDIK